MMPVFWNPAESCAIYFERLAIARRRNGKLALWAAIIVVDVLAIWLEPKLRRNLIIIYMGLELMLNAANLAFVAFSRFNHALNGQVMVFFVITVAAAEVAVGCESCHGPGSAHVEAGGDKSKIFVFRQHSSAEQSKQCLTCHGRSDEHGSFLRSKHGRSDVSCITCHSIHQGRPPRALPRRP